MWSRPGTGTGSASPRGWRYQYWYWDGLRSGLRRGGARVVDEAPDGRRTDTGRRHACSPHTFWDRWRERGRAHSVAAGEGEEGLATEAPRVVERAELGAARVVPGRRRGGVRGVPGGRKVDQSDESRDGAGVAAWLGSCARGGREEERERQQVARRRARRHREGARGGVAPEAAPRAPRPFRRSRGFRGFRGKKRTPAVGGCRGVRPIVT